MTPFSLHPQLESDSLFLRDMPLCQLRLQNQSAVPWLILIPRRADITEIHRLNRTDQVQLIEEIAVVSHMMEHIHKPDKINVGALGNIVPQLHVHIVARFKTDPAWPGPVWGKLEPSVYAPDRLKKMQQIWHEAAI